MSEKKAAALKNIEKQQPAVVAETLHHLVAEDLGREAKKIYNRYRRARPESLEMTMLYADILINADRLDEALRLLEDELKKHPGHFELLFRLAGLDEIRGDYINAFDLYRKAEERAITAGHRREVQAALAQVKEQITSEVYFTPGSFTIKLKGNNNPLNLQYLFARQLQRLELLEVLRLHLDPGAKTVLELECDTGVISRNLAEHGFRVEGMAEQVADTVLSMGFEYVEMLRKTTRRHHLSFHRLEAGIAAVWTLQKKDVILLLPSRMQWYEEKGKEAGTLAKELIKKAKRQFFFYLPAAAKQGSGEDAPVKEILAMLEEKNASFSPPRLLHQTEEGGALYCIEKSRAKAADISRVMPSGLQVTGTRSSVFEVEVERCRSLNGFGFGEGAWNHFQAALEEMLSKPDLNYEESILKRFFASFQPKSRQEQLFGELAADLHPLQQGWTLLPWAESKNRRLNASESPVLNNGGNPHYGPNTGEFGTYVLKRLLATYTLIKQFGYRPEIFPDGYIQGYLLKDGADYRFYVNEGQHRMAAVGLLGFEQIRVKFNPDFLPVVDIKNIRQWPQVKNGLYEKKVAEKVFYYYFEENGRKKAKELGLV